MANEYTLGQKIAGIGAALGGRVPQFQQQMEQLDEKRMEAMYKDAGAAYQLLNNKDYQGIINLANDRLGLLQRLPGSDPADTMQVLQLAQGAAAGNYQSLSQLTQVLEAANQQGLSRGKALLMSPNQLRLLNTQHLTPETAHKCTQMVRMQDYLLEKWQSYNVQDKFQNLVSQ